MVIEIEPTTILEKRSPTTTENRHAQVPVNEVEHTAYTEQPIHVPNALPGKIADLVKRSMRLISLE